MSKLGIVFLILALQLTAEARTLRHDSVEVPAETSLSAALKMAESTSPELRSSKARAEAFIQGAKGARAADLPEVDLAAVVSRGDPGSFAFGGVDNNISSANRVGQGASLVVKQNIWDFGRTSAAVKAAELSAEMEGQQSVVSQMDLDREVLQTYLNCAILKSQVRDAKFLAEQAQMLATETGRFVKSGQRSVVEKSLVEAQAKEAQTRTAEFSERVAVIEQRLAIELGRATGEPVHCGSLAAVESEIGRLNSGSETNPQLAVQELRIRVVESRLEQARAENLPSLVGIATGGYFDNPSLADKLNYSYGVGLVLPLFSGFRIESQVGEASARLRAEQANLEGSRQRITETNSRYDEQIRSLTVRLDFLRSENKLASDTFALAKKRYMSLQGNMIDLREAIRNLDRVLQATAQTDRDLFLAKGERALYNGIRF